MCQLCRRLERAAPGPEHYAYWTSRFSYAEIVELAAGWRLG
jgi:hypothetical protein